MDYLVIGAGPAGLQLGYFLARAGRDYQILEAGLDLKNANCPVIGLKTRCRSKGIGYQPISAALPLRGSVKTELLAEARST